MLVRLCRPDHRVTTGVEVGGSVPVGTQVAARRQAAGEALPEVDPRIAELRARGADPEWRIDPQVGLEVLAVSRHVAVRPMCPGPGGSLVAGPRGADSTPYGADSSRATQNDPGPRRRARIDGVMVSVAALADSAGNPGRLEFGCDRPGSFAEPASADGELQ
jgi:hypothetical protein